MSTAQEYGDACEWLRENSPVGAFVIQAPAPIDRDLTPSLSQRRIFVAKISAPERRVPDYEAIQWLNRRVLEQVKEQHHLEFPKNAPLLAKLRSRTEFPGEIYVLLETEPERMSRIKQRNSPSLVYQNAGFAVFRLVVLE